jgi:hypothetical protein
MVIVIVYQGQKLHFFPPSLSFLAEAQPRLENRREQNAKDIIGKITNLFCIKEKHLLIHINKFFIVCICY